MLVIQFTMLEIIEREQIVTFDKLEPANIEHVFFIND